MIDELNINTDLVRRLLTDFIRHELHVVGFQKAVVALSGGIDSAVTAYLSAEALGPENVLAVRMPYQTSSPDSLDHAMLVIEELGVMHDTVDITPLVEPYFEREPDIDRVRRGNVMGRARMLVVYDLSAKISGLVVGTGNKTEALLGYTTIFGVDSAAAIQPIADLYKYQVRQIARALSVPDVIVNKPPSADLWPGQTDEGELGYSYDDADRVLYRLVDQRMSIDEVVSEGFPQDFVEQLWRRVRQMQYKRRLPLIPKLSERTLGHDFRYLRDWGARHED
ncbi:MAG: NAD+ synthase [Chloroflexi bacterium]|nr:NAD+ synthase [Chloroflexota bacterium]